MAKKYTKSYSNYVLKSNPTPSTKGYIYENDLPTTSQQYNTVNGSNITSTDGGFVFIVNSTPDDTKQYNTEGWAKNQYTLSNITVTSDDFVSVDNSTVKSTVKSNKYVKLNKSYTDLSKYCYFGSSNAMLESAVNDIISKFPAGLYVKTVNPNTINGNLITLSIDSNTGNTDNKFSIDLFNYYKDEVSSLTYNLRTMITSYSDYEIINISTDNSGNTVENYIASIIGFTGYTVLNPYTITFMASEPISNELTYIIRPIESKRNDFFNNLDDFQSVLLNQYTIPKYRSYFKIPVEGNSGIDFEYKSFIWSTTDGYNIDIESSDYVIFMSELVTSTNLIDEYYTDNIYRMLTHDTIKNLDNTYAQVIDEEYLEEVIAGGTKIQKILRIYGASYDDVKKYIEGISFANTITHDGKNNLPTDYLAGRLETSGWDVFSLSGNLADSGTTTSGIYPSTTKILTVEDVNNELMKNLILNSKNIFKSKGTKKSIRKILGLLGFNESWYEIREYIQFVDGFITGNTLEKIASLNYVIYPENYSVLDGKEPYDYEYDPSFFENTNIGVYVKCPICGSENYIVSGDTYTDYNTAICIDCAHSGITTVFDITGNTIGYPQPLSGSSEYYFQQKGNWYRETGGVHTDLSGNTYVNEISYGNNPHIGNGEYDGGYDYIDQFSNIFKRFIRNSGNVEIPSVTGYTGIGFDISAKKTVDNVKISYATEDNKKLLNLKNFVIGINGDEILQSFFNNNTSVQAFTNYNNNNTININDNNESLIQIINISGNTSITNINVSTSGAYIKIHNSILGNGSNIQCQGGISLGPGKTLLIKNISGNTTTMLYNGDDEFEILKSISLPYVEQLVPSTAIFDFMLINSNKPKWLLVDEYCHRNEYGNFDGYKVLVYQDVNYFDTETAMYDTGLTQTIVKDFGTGFTFSGLTMKSNDFITEISEEYKYMENLSGELTELRPGFETLFFFTGLSTDCGLNTDPDWVVDTHLIDESTNCDIFIYIYENQGTDILGMFASGVTASNTFTWSTGRQVTGLKAHGSSVEAELGDVIFGENVYYDIISTEPGMTYTVTVIDSNGCEQSMTYTVGGTLETTTTTVAPTTTTTTTVAPTTTTTTTVAPLIDNLITLQLSHPEGLGSSRFALTSQHPITSVVTATIFCNNTGYQFNLSVGNILLIANSSTGGFVNSAQITSIAPTSDSTYNYTFNYTPVIAYS